MTSDLRHSLRNLARNPRFSLVTILTLAVGMGAAAAIFNVTDWILFRATKFPEDVFLIGGRNDSSGVVPVRFDFMARAYAESASCFSEYGKAVMMSDNVVLDGQPVGTSWLGVSSNLFSMLGIKPRLGRGFLAGEDVEGSNDVVIVSEQFWKQHLGASSEAIGRKISVGSAVCTVVGVLRGGQNFPAYFFSDVYRPLAYRFDPARPWIPTLFLLGRLRSGFTREQAVQMLDAAPVDIPQQMKPFITNDHPLLSSMAEINHLMHVEIYWVMIGAVGFLYAIACLNASNLTLVRMLGCSRAGVVRLLVLDSLLIGAISSVFALLVANWLFPILLRTAGDAGLTERWSGWFINWRVAGVLATLTVCTSVFIVVIPAIRIFRANVQAGLKDGGAALGESPALARLRGGFVVLQAAFAVVLLAGAGLMIQTFHRLENVDLGFDPHRRAKVKINFPADYSTDADKRLALLRAIQTELRSVPGVTAVGFGNDILLPGYYFSVWSMENPGGKPLPVAMVGFNQGYQEAAGIHLKQGHWFGESDGNEVMVNEAFARARWPNEDPVGKLVRPANGNPWAGPKWQGWTVAGVLADVKSTVRDAPGFYVYSPERRSPENFDTFVLLLSRDYDELLASTVRRKLYALDPQLIVSQVISMEKLRNNQLWTERLANSVLKVLSGIALTLALVGVFSVLAYTVDRRMNEFGVRIALGATQRDLVRLVMRRGLALTALGVVGGVVGALALTRFLQSLLYKTSAQDPWVLASVSILLLLASSLACLLPSLRAGKADVAKLLRTN